MFPGHQSFLAGTVKKSLDLLHEYVFQGHMICFMFRDHHSFIAGTVKITRSSAQICLSRSLNLQHWYVFKSPDLLHGFVFQDHTICCMFPYHQSFIADVERRRRRRQRRWWTRPWLSPERRRSFGLYDQLMTELRREDRQSFVHFLRMPTEMFDEILQRVGPRIAKQNTFYRNPLEPGLNLAITLRHLASGAKYPSMQYGLRVPHNTISVFIPEVCQAIIDEYVDGVMPFPSTMDDWKRIAEGFMEKWNFPHALGALDGKHVAYKCPPGSGSTYFNYKKFYSIVLLALVDSDYKFICADIGGRGAASDAQLWNASDLKSAIEDGDLDLPDAEPLPHDTEDIPYFYI
ncbi:Hypothetical predicted protein, partial [Mytilus galloprovincialis]